MACPDVFELVEYVLADKRLKDSYKSVKQGSASMDQPVLFAQPFEHRASECGAGWPQLLLGEGRILDWVSQMGRWRGKSLGWSVDWMNVLEMGIGRPCRTAELRDRLESGLDHCSDRSRAA